jgi:hypothetical protein
MVTKLLLSLLAASLLGSGILILQHKRTVARYEKEVRELQSKAIEYQAQIYRQEAELKDRQAVQAVRERKHYANQKIEQAVGAGDDAALRRLFVELGMLGPDAIRPASPGGKSGPGH